MSPSRITSRAALGAVLSVGAITALVGCGAGQVNTIGDEVSAVNGATGHIQQIDILNATIDHPPGDAQSYQAGESALLDFSITNAGVKGDNLVSISTPAAQQVTLKGQTDIPGGTNIVAGASNGVEVGGRLIATMEGLTTEVKPGPTVSVTFTFARSGAITLPLPVDTPTRPR